MRSFCLVVILLLLTVECLGQDEGGLEEPSEGIEGVDDEVVVGGEEKGDEVKEEERVEDSVGKELAKDSSIPEENLDVKNSRREEEKETSKSEGGRERSLEGLDDKLVVDEREDQSTSTEEKESDDQSTPTEREDPQPTSANEGPCSVCSCSTLDDMGNSMKMNNKKFSDMVDTLDETLIQIDCSQLNLSTWIPMQQTPSLAVDFSHNLLSTLPTFTQVKRGENG